MTLQNLTMVKGNDFDIQFIVTNNGAPANISGFSFKFTAKYNRDDTDLAAVISLAYPTNITVTNAAAGQATVSIPATATSTLPQNDVFLFYDLRLTDNTLKIRTLAQGKLKVVPAITIS